MEITKEKNNHSKRCNYRNENINKTLFTTLCSTYFQDIKKDSNIENSNSKLSEEIDKILYKAAKESTEKKILVNNNLPEDTYFGQDLNTMLDELTLLTLGSTRTYLP